MEANIDSKQGGERRVWQPFLSYLVVFVFSATVCSLLPTPNSWSDVRSQWVPSAAIALLALCLIVASIWIYRRSGQVFKIQAIILWVVFGGVLIAAACDLYASIGFLKEVRGHL
jgi:F0F1-type ATP synthase membrane subunit a